MKRSGKSWSARCPAHDDRRPRLDAAGADVSRIMALTAVRGRDDNGDYTRPIDLSRDLQHIGAAVDNVTDCRLVVIDLDRAGVQELIPDGDRLRFRPRSALTPDLAERLRAHKRELLAILRPAEGPGGVNPALADGTARWPTRP